MRVLFLSCHLPYPPISGGRRREYELLRRLARTDEVDLVAISKTYEEDLKNRGALEAFCANVHLFEARPEGADDSLPAQVRRHRCPPAARHLARILPGPYDLVHVEGFYLVPLLPAEAAVPVLLGEQNVEFELWRQRAAVASEPAVRFTHLREAARTRAAEIAAWRRSDLCAAVTAEDRTLMTRAAPGLEVRVVPDGVERRAPDGGQDNAPSLVRDTKADAMLSASHGDASRPTVVFVANFAYQPNEDAAAFLCEHIFPAVLREVPSARLLLVGNEPPDRVRRYGDGQSIVVTGPVPETEPYLVAADVVACPLRIGGGVKVKMLDALAHGKAVVSTSVGAQGLARVRDAFVVADEPDVFARHVATLLRDAGRREAQERRAADAVRRLPTWADAARSLRSCYQEIVARGARRWESQDRRVA